MAVIKQIPWIEPEKLFLPYAEQKGAILLDSKAYNSETGRYSYIGLDPISEIKNIAELQSALINNIQFSNNLKTLDKNLPPFTGGFMGYISYDFGRSLENLPSIADNDQNYPDLVFFCYPTIFAFDNLLKTAFIIANSYNNNNPSQNIAKFIKYYDAAKKNKINNSVPKIDLISNITPQEYQAKVSKIQEYILEGDIFEANFTQRFSAKLSQNYSVAGIYSKLANNNPAPFAACANFGDLKILSSSPEGFLKINSEKHIETRPIKGTIARSDNAAKLLNCRKNRAENVMIADLMRNDLSKVCTPESILVTKLAGLETYSSVHHLVSVIQGKMQDNLTPVDAILACFPGGSITGAPKIRAMEIIDELEKTRRGPYCGSLGYIGFNQTMNLSILIRSIIINKEFLSISAGGAVTLDSCPKLEHQESLIKAKALLEIFD